MKLSSWLLAVACAGLAFTACKKDDSTVTPTEAWPIGTWKIDTFNYVSSKNGVVNAFLSVNAPGTLDSLLLGSLIFNKDNTGKSILKISRKGSGILINDTTIYTKWAQPTTSSFYVVESGDTTNFVIVSKSDTKTILTSSEKNPSDSTEVNVRFVLSK